MELVGSESTQAPTLPQLGRMLSCQMIVGNGWTLQPGDIRCAFLEADALDRTQGPRYLSSSQENPRSAAWISNPHFGNHAWSK